MSWAQPHRAYPLLAGTLVLFLLGAGWGVWVPPDPRQPVLARAGEVEVTADVFRTQYVDYLLKTGLQDQPRLRATFLQNLIASRLLVRETREAGIEHEAAYRLREEEVRRKLLIEVYTHRTLFDTLSVAEGDVRAMFVRAHTQLKARHLYARTHEQAEVLGARLQAGEAFEALAREVFVDPQLAESGGSLGYFGFDEMDASFEDAAYALDIGEISPPVRTAQGYSIIQLEDRFTDPMVSEAEYAKRRPKLEGYVRHRKQQQARRMYVRGLVERLDIVFEDAILDRLLGQVTGTAMVNDTEAAAALMAKPLVTFGWPAHRYTWTVDAFRQHAQFTSEQQRAQVRTRQALVDFIQGLIVREVMMAQALEQGLDASSDFEQAMTEALDDWVLDQARQRLAAEVEVPADSARYYFETATPREFMMPAQVRLAEVLVETKAKAEQVQQQLPYLAFDLLARTHSLRPGARETGGDLGFLDAAALGPWAEVVFNASEGDVLGPLEMQGRYALFKVGARRADRPMTYDEARPQITEILRHRYTSARQQKANAAVRARYDIDVDTQLLYSMSLTDENNS